MLAAVYWYTYEPAFEVTIRWREGVAWTRRVELERRFGLVERRNHERRSRTYDLIDTRPGNIRALAGQPEVEDSGIIDTRTFTVPPDAPYGRGWMWAGDRWPVVRQYRLLPLVVLACGLTIACAARREMRARGGPGLRLLAAAVAAGRRRVDGAGQRVADSGGVGS